MKEVSKEYLDGFDVILVGTNCYQSMRNGFQYTISQLYPDVQRVNLETKYADKTKLGTIEVCKTYKPEIVLCYIVPGYSKANNKLDFDALEKCLMLVNITYKGKTIVTTLMGSSKFDGNAGEKEVLEVFKKTLKDCNVKIIKPEEKTRDEIRLEKYKNRYNNNNTNKES